MVKKNIKKKNITSDEIDLSNILITIWEKKWTFVVFIALSLVVMVIIYPNKTTNKIIAKTFIKPISVFEETQYELIFSNLNSLNSMPSIGDKNDEYSKNEFTLIEEYKDLFNSYKKPPKNLQFINIDKELLLDLFMDNVQDNYKLKQKIEKFNLIKKENYSNQIEYSDAVNDLVSSFKIFYKKGPSGEELARPFIQFEYYRLENLENFLNFLVKEINNEIQKKLSDTYTSYVNYVELNNSYKIEDIDSLLRINDDEEFIVRLQLLKNFLLEDKQTERLQKLFNSSPLSKPDEFYAATIESNKTIFTVANNNEASIKVRYFIAIVIGSILATFFLLIINSIKKYRT